MLTELSPNESLTAVMSGSAAATNPHAFVMWSIDGGPSNHTYTALSGATAVTLLSAPTAGQRIVKSVKIFNGDTAAVTITLSKVIDGTSRTLEKVTLGVGGSATITEAGVTAVDASGQVLQSAPSAMVDIDAGSSGTAGTVDIFPATAESGKFILSCTDQDADTNVTLKPAAMGQATVVSIPDPGAATANVLLTDAPNDGAVVTATAAELNQLDGTVLTAGSILANMATTAGVGITGTADNFASSVEKIGTLFKTTIVIDLGGLNSGGAANDIIGADGAGVAHLGQITAARNGTIFAGVMTCLETPATGDNDIDLWSATENTGVEDTLVTDLTETQLTNGGDLTNASRIPLTAFPAANEYLYLAGATGDADATYSTGILVIELWGK